MAEANANIKEGALFSVIAPFGEAARVIQQSEMESERLNPHNTYCVIKGDNGYLWRGSKSNECEHVYAKALFDHF